MSADHLTLLQTKTIIYEEIKSDPGVIDQERNMVVMKNLERHHLNAVKDQIESKLRVITLDK